MFPPELKSKTFLIKVLEHLFEDISLMSENPGEKQTLLFCYRSQGEEKL